MLYLRLTLDLIERGRLPLKSANYSVMPVSLPEVFLLMFNLKFSSVHAFERAAIVLNIMMAALHPVDLNTLRQMINAGRTDVYVSHDHVKNL